MMRTVLILKLLIFTAAPVLSQEWKSINFPSPESITGIIMFSPDSGCVVTADGNFGWTVDGGKKWLRSGSLEGIRLESLSFVDKKTGWICGHKGRIYFTADGGHLWESQSWKDTMAVFVDIQMINKDTGIVVGIFADTGRTLSSIALRTTDGGKNWQELEPLGIAYSEACYEKSTKTLYFMSLGRMNSSTDNGRKWQSVGTHEGPPARTFSFYQNAGIMAGPKGVCGYTVDGGKVWYKNVRSTGEHFIASAMADTKNGFIGGLNGLLLSTKDGGRNWETETLPKSFTILDLFATNDTIYAAGSDGTILFRRLRQ